MIMNTLEPLHSASTQSLSETSNDIRHTHTRLRLCIPRQYSQEPIISRLITQHQLTVNITAALLSANAREAGWFDLELQGTNAQIRSALIYLNDLDLKIWEGNDFEEGW
jgi:ABC-type methionine transport system ATPase subunit